MRLVVYGSTKGLDDAQAFVRDIEGSAPDATGDARRLFPPGRDVFVTRAPATVALFGGVAELAGARAIRWPTSEACLVAFQRDPGGTLTVVSSRPDRIAGTLTFEMPFHYLESDGRPVGYDVARQYLARYDDRQWVAPIAGLFLALMREWRLRFSEGARLRVFSTIRGGDRQVERAALAMAVVRAVCAEATIRFGSRDLAELCRRGLDVASEPAPHGTLMAAAQGVPGALMATSLQPGAPPDHLPLHEDLALFVIRPRATAGSARREWAASAAIAYRIVAGLAGLGVARAGQGVVRVVDPTWRGWLANIPSDALARLEPGLPDEISGRDFLARFDGIADRSLVIDPHRTYYPRAAARHVATEHELALAFQAHLARAPADDALAALGELVARAETSALKLGIANDALVEASRRLRAAGATRGLVATRAIESGAIVALARPDAASAVGPLAASCVAAGVEVIAGSSPGAIRLGYVRLRGR